MVTRRIEPQHLSFKLFSPYIPLFKDLGHSSMTVMIWKSKHMLAKQLHSTLNTRFKEKIIFKKLYSLHILLILVILLTDNVQCRLVFNSRSRFTGAQVTQPFVVLSRFNAFHVFLISKGVNCARHYTVFV